MCTLRRGSEPVFLDDKVDNAGTLRTDVKARLASGTQENLRESKPEGLLSRRFPHLSGLVFIALLTSVPSVVDAAEICMPSDELDAALMEWYGETVVGPGPNGTVLWASDASQTWTLVRYSEDGEACSVSHGTEMPENVLLIAME